MIDLRKIRTNTKHRFGADAHYHEAVVIDTDGRMRPALFTDSQIQVALQRAKDNPEDAPDVRPWWERWFG